MKFILFRIGYYGQLIFNSLLILVIHLPAWGTISEYEKISFGAISLLTLVVFALLSYDFEKRLKIGSEKQNLIIKFVFLLLIGFLYIYLYFSGDYAVRVQVYQDIGEGVQSTHYGPSFLVRYLNYTSVQILILSFVGRLRYIKKNLIYISLNTIIGIGLLVFYYLKLSVVIPLSG